MQAATDPQDESTAPPAIGATVRHRVIQKGVRAGLPLPDALLALLFASVAILPLIRPDLAIPIQEFGHQLLFGLLIEGGFLMMQGSLVDVATRLKARPPLWAGIGIMVLLLVFSMGSLETLQMVWERGGWPVLIPLFLSMGERATLMWRLPGRPRIEKVAERALVSDRITMGFGLVAVLIATMLSVVIFKADFGPERILLAGGALYYGVAAFDSWRVRGKRFAEKPRVLFGYDFIGIEDMPSL